MAGDSSVIPEYCIFGYRLARFDSLEEIPKVRSHVVPIVAVINRAVVRRFVAGYGIVLGMPLLLIFTAQFFREAVRVVAGRSIYAALR